MSRATVIVRLELEGDAGALVDSIEGLDGALCDHFKPEHYGVKLVGNVSITTKNEWKL